MSVHSTPSWDYPVPPSRQELTRSSCPMVMRTTNRGAAKMTLGDDMMSLAPLNRLYEATQTGFLSISRVTKVANPP